MKTASRVGPGEDRQDLPELAAAQPLRQSRGIGAFVSSVPLAVWLVAVAAAAVHMAPYLRAAAQTPDGWTFTANLSVSPDYMQYRVWMRQTQAEGPVITNIFTTEPNGAHLPVPMYWMIGLAAELTGLTPEWTYAWAGSLVAFAFVVLLWAVVRRFIARRDVAAWTFGALLLGGGLGGYIQLLRDWDWARSNHLISTLLLEPLTGPEAPPIFEAFRGNYIVQALFDTHFLTFWLFTTAAVLALYHTLKRFTTARLLGTAVLFAAGTFLHVYEGLTLLVITAAIVVLCYARGIIGRKIGVLTMSVTGCAVAVVVMAVYVAFKRSGLPAPTWRGETIVFSILVMAYPVAFAALLWGFGRYWQQGGLDRIFLAGWAAGGLALVLAGPFFPYPDRGTMTLQIPLMLMAAAIWVDRRGRVGWVPALVLLLGLGSTPFWMTRSLDQRTVFDQAESHKWLSPEQSATIDVLRAAGREDVLVADQPNLRWLAPEYPGRHYAGHFFLTVRFRSKQDALQAFYQNPDAEARRTFLDEWGARWLYVDEQYDLSSFATLPGVRLVRHTNVGALFEVRAEDGSTAR